MKDLKDPSKLSIVTQFIQLLQAGGQHQGGMAGLNQFVTFLSQQDRVRRLARHQFVIYISYLYSKIIIKTVLDWCKHGRINTTDIVKE